MISCGRIFEWVGFCSTCGAKRKSAWLLHSREHLLSPVQDVEDPRSLQWTERQFWFTVAMMCVIFECSADTIRRRVETLVNTGDIDETQNCVSLTNVQAFGYNTTTLYNLNVLNQLAMVCIDNPKYLRRFWCHKNLLYQIWYKRFFRHTGQTGG